MKIILVGYMGSGKSSIGKKVAEVLRLPFKDMDTEIEKAEGISVSKIFSEKGEVYFRKVENTILKEILKNPHSFVLATGGGTPCYSDAMEFIQKQKNIVSVYLKIPIDILVSRLFSEKAERPLIAHLGSEVELEDFIRKHLFERAFYYNQADLIIAVGPESVAKTVEKIILKLF